ncbi:MAG: septal ring lytic transglycosylase RlpA family protein [Gammaproteobacteria bacterium]|nr:septal ring lytic transglycosylase RlpA family protein [Gammaproteobacteria bacterium]
MHPLRPSLLPLPFLLLAACSTLPPAPPEVESRDGPGSTAYSDPGELEPIYEPFSPKGNMESYEVDGQIYQVLKDNRGFIQEGVASWYGSKFHGRETSNGERYDMYAMSGAHKQLPLPTYLRVTNLENGRSTIIRVNDRGPFVKNRIVDLSYAAAIRLGFADQGTTRVRLEAITTPTQPLVTTPPPEPVPLAADGSVITAAKLENSTPVVTPLVDDSSSIPANRDPLLGESETASSPTTVTEVTTESPPVTPSPSATGPTADGIPSPPYPFHLQAGAFSSQENAEKIRQLISDLKIGPVSILEPPSADTTVYRVRIGPFQDEQQLLKTQENLGAIGVTSSRVIP